MDYRFDQNISREDYITFVTNHMKRQMLRPLNLVFFAVSVGYLMISPFITEERDFTFFFIGLGVIALITILYFFSKRTAGKQFDNNKDGFKMSYEVNEESLVYIVEEGNISKMWAEFYSVKETEEHMFLYVTKQRGMLLIKNQIPTEALALIKRRFTESLPAKKIKLLP